MKKYYLYLHYKPNEHQPFYVGWGSGSRAYQKRSRNKWWENIVNKFGYRVEIIHTNLTEKQAKCLEIKFIKYYGRADINTGILVNMTDGGDGSTGYHHSEKSKQKISLTHIGRKKTKQHKEKISLAKFGNKGRKGIPHKEETKIKISKAQKGKSRRPFTKNEKKVMSDAIRRSWILRRIKYNKN